ncbi:hypothetical protein VTI74DRAFT_5843 [Chaetomium olivicolor]
MGLWSWSVLLVLRFRIHPASRSKFRQYLARQSSSRQLPRAPVLRHTDRASTQSVSGQQPLSLSATISASIRIPGVVDSGRSDTPLPDWRPAVSLLTLLGRHGLVVMEA